MESRLIPLKIKQRLNKQSSADYDNIQCWQFVEAYNKAQLEWVREQLRGLNLEQAGAEENITKLDDLEVLITDKDIKGTNKTDYFESIDFPSDYMRFNRIDCKGSTALCTGKPMTITLIESSNINAYLNDDLKSPDFEWAHTFAVIRGNKLRIYTDGKFKIRDVVLSYYRFPVDVSLAGCQTFEDDFPINVDPELKKDVVELIIDAAATIIAGDIESLNQLQRLQASTDKGS